MFGRGTAAALVVVLTTLTGCALLPGDDDERRPGERAAPRERVEPRVSDRDRIATLNVLGASHTGPEGDSKPDWPTYEKRLGGVMDALDANRVTLAGLQELQKPQWRQLGEEYGEVWGVYPRTDEVITANSIVWRKADWRLRSARQFDIPYFGGNPQAQARATLERRSDGLVVHLVNVHNPFDLGGNDNEPLRQRALRIERRLVERLGADGDPVYLVGDFNERKNPHCLLGRAGMDNTFGEGAASPCEAPGRAGVDMVFSLNTEARRARVDGSVMANRYADHPLVTVPLPARDG